MHFGTVIVNLERHQVVDLLPDRAVSSVAKWFNDHPGAELLSRERAGIYAGGARRGAPRARQVADRFHLLMNFRESIARELSGVGPPIRENAVHASLCERRDDEEAAHQNGVSLVRRADRQVLCAQIRALYDERNTVQDIDRQPGLAPRRVYRWVRRISPPERNVMKPKSDTYVALSTDFPDLIAKDGLLNLFDDPIPILEAQPEPHWAGNPVGS